MSYIFVFSNEFSFYYCSVNKALGSCRGGLPAVVARGLWGLLAGGSITRTKLKYNKKGCGGLPRGAPCCCVVSKRGGARRRCPPRRRSGGVLPVVFFLKKIARRVARDVDVLLGGALGLSYRCVECVLSIECVLYRVCCS